MRLPLSFWLLALSNLFVGGMVGLERTVVPLLGEQVFELQAGTAVAAFIISFSISKAITNLLAGYLADWFGRKAILCAGWLVALPIPFVLIWSNAWSQIIFANVLLGVNQALTWSMTVNMMVDLVPLKRRGFAVGINEFAGYLGLSLLAFLTGIVAANYGLRPEPFYLGIAVSIFGLALSLSIKETLKPNKVAALAWVNGVGLPSLLGTATNLKDGLVWLSLPLLLSARGSSLTEIAAVAALYPLLWALGQLLFGPWSDHIGRRLPISLGMAIQGLGLLLLALAHSFVLALLASALLGLGTSMVYPTLIASVADRVAENRRATALGVYRFFRDSGYAMGALLVGATLVFMVPVLYVIGFLMLCLALLAWFQL